MIKTKIRYGGTLVLAVLAALAGVTAAEAQWSAEPVAPQPAVVSASAGTVQFYPTVSYDRAVLTVSRGDVVFSRVFSGTDRPALDRYDPAGNELADGVYSWELQLIPNKQTARELRISATYNDGKAPQAWTAQSGTFAVRGGVIASSDQIEAGAAREASPRVAASPVTSFRTRGRGTTEDSDGSSRNEAQVRASAAAVSAAAPMMGAGLQAAGANGAADSDVFAAPAGATPAAAMRFANEAAAPHRSVESGGKNGRPERDD